MNFQLHATYLLDNFWLRHARIDATLNKNATYTVTFVGDCVPTIELIVDVAALLPTADELFRNWKESLEAQLQKKRAK